MNKLLVGLLLVGTLSCNAFAQPTPDPLTLLACKECTWNEKVMRKIKPNITFNAGNFKGNQQTIVQIRLAPDGEILSKTLTQSSGDADWNQAVLDALTYTKSIPKDNSGNLPTLNLEIKLKPR